MRCRPPVFRVAALSILSACLALLGTGCGKPMPSLAGKKADWADFGYQKIAGPMPRNFDIKFTARGIEKEAPPHGRLAFNVQDPANYYFIDLGKSSTEVGRVENGIEVHIGSRAKAGIGVGEPHKIVVERRSAAINVVMDETVIASAYDDTFAEGDVFLGAAGASVAYEKPSVQKVEKPYFTDDFMKAEGESSDWEWQTVAGDWEVSHIENPSLSSNAFCLVKKEGDAEGKIVLSPFDHWFWDDYSYSVSVRPLDNRPVGALFYYRDPDNYYLLKWGGQGSDFSKMELIKKHHGEETVLAASEGGFTPDQWYLIRIEVIDTHATVSIDDHVVFDLEDPNLCYGTVGLYSSGGKGARFDDVVVKSAQAYREDFREYSAGRWVELGGTWKVVSESGGVTSFVVNTDSGPAKALSGESNWRNYTYTARVGPWATGTAGICFYYQDEQNYYCFQWRKGFASERALVKVVNGKETVLRRDKPPKGGSGRYVVGATVDDGHILVTVDGETVFEEWDADLDCGRIGLYASETPSALFSDVAVRFAREKSAMPTMQEAFSRETTMSDWSSVTSDWQDPRSHTIGEEVAKAHWCRADFPGDVDIELRHLPKLEQGAQIRLMLAGDGDELLSGYALVVSPGKKDNCAIWRQDKAVVTASLDTSEDLRNLRFRKAGRYVAALIGRRLLAQYRDEKPLRGTKIGYLTMKTDIKKTEIEIFSDDVLNYTFRESIYDWRVASGTWEVTNRWQCDPRWSFFSGRSNKLAAIWNKREMKGDITVEFFAGPKMDQDRGRKYEYVSDMNLTICADGKDLTSGYSFIFGGYQNSRTRIMKGSKVLGERFKRIPSEENIHRRWFHLKAQRTGKHLEFYIDNELVLECDDPEPLDGGHVAVWTYNNGIMVSRVRISTGSDERKDSPFAHYPEACKCVYDEST